MNLIALAERVEAAEGPSVELDEEIAAALAGAVREVQPDGRTAYHTGARWVSVGAVKPVTSSLDAAMTLLREGSEISLTNLYGVARAHVDMNDEGGGWYGEHLGGNLTLALTAAALRAIAQGATT